MSLSRRCSRTACGRPAVNTLTYVYADSTAVLGPLATYAEPHAYDLCEVHCERLTRPTRLGRAPAGARPARGRTHDRRPAGPRRRRPRGGPAGPAGRPPRRAPRPGARPAGAATCGCSAPTDPRLGPLPVRVAAMTTWIPPTWARSSRPTTSAALVPEQLDEELARRVGAAFVAVVGARNGRRRPRHARQLAGPGRRVRPGRHERRRRRRAASGWRRPTSSTSPPAPRPRRRDVHREPQPRGVQRHQDVPRSAPSRSAWSRGWPRSATPQSAGDTPVAERLRRGDRAPTCSRRTPSTCSRSRPSRVAG